MRDSFVRRWAVRLTVGLTLLVGLTGAGVVYLSSLPVPTPPPPQMADGSVGTWPQVLYAPSADGWQLALSHYAPCWRGSCVAGAIAPEPRTPVILCHGLAVNRYNFDLSEHRSIARYLADRGFDVWNLELRGHGLSRRDAPGEPTPWGIREYIEEDAPAAIAFVRAQTGAPAVHWVGHSMGGLVLMGLLATQPDAPVASGVVMGSPGHLRDRDGRLGIILSLVSLAPDDGVGLPARANMRLTAKLTGKPGFPEFAWPAESVADEAGRWFMANGMDDVQPTELAGFIKMYKEGDFVSRDGEIRFYEGYPGITTPLRFMAGAADALGSPASIKHMYDGISSPEKDYVLLGTANGFSTDYGHGDQCIGDRAEEEVFPLVLSWLVEHPVYPGAEPEQGL